jgi:hypothetical protein
MIEFDKLTPYETAKILIDNKVSYQDYKIIQDRRKERLALWIQRDINILVVKEAELIEYGEKVLELLYWLL